MKILFVAQRVPFPPNKGEKIRTFNQLKYLSENDHQIIVCAPLEQDEDINYFKELADKYCDDICCYPLSAKPLRLLKGLITGQALSVANFYSKELQQKFDDMLSEVHFDAVICTSSAMAEYIYKSTVFQSLTPKALLLMDFMDLDSDKWRQYAESSRWPMKWVYQREVKLLSQFEHKITHDFDCSFFIADAEVNLFKSQWKDAGKVLTMGNGLDTELFTPAKTLLNNKAPICLFTGVMDYKPNVDAVVWFVKNTWQNILVQYPEAKFIIAGMKPTAEVKNLEKLTGVEVTGFVEDILPYYHQSDYFVAPFRLARGLQNKVLQAFACGLPVISTPMGAEGIECVEGRDILVANTPREFLSCVKRLENELELKKSIKENALRLIHEKYSWEGKLQVLDDVLNGDK